MAKLLCVFSTLAASVHYAARAVSDNGVSVPQEGVLIKGGAGVMGAENIQTPKGVATMVTEAQAELLKNDAVFKLHALNGYVKLEGVDRPPGENTVEKAVAEMDRREPSSPTVAADFTANGAKPPVDSTAS